ncbi:hypothetical protein WJM97_02370 [Okeanomitos corallinicola TIOX110]|uniref:Uncharacterized protein n=1 Tax=Okeanomitos corallinicola TIOX110 TaxID=3133117 RepID=A0ABZ2UT28_9CYAN
MNNDEKSALIAQLGDVKHTPEKIVKIAKQADGKIVFLEEGKPGRKGSGLLHILERHKEDFAKRGISEDEIADVVIIAVTNGIFLGYQGTVEPRREIYEVKFKGKKHYIAVTVGDNGYIVGANPASLP